MCTTPQFSDQLWAFIASNAPRSTGPTPIVMIPTTPPSPITSQTVELEDRGTLASFQQDTASKYQELEVKYGKICNIIDQNYHLFFIKVY